MSDNPPKNHHYVPRHFLKAWSFDGKKLYRYKLQPWGGDLEVQKASLDGVASEHDLYTVEFPDGRFETETSHVTPQVDVPGFKVLERARSSSVCEFDAEDLRELANYVVLLEARNPKILKIMDIRPQLSEIAEQSIRDGLKKADVDHVADYLKLGNLGPVSLGLFIKNESDGRYGKPFAEGLASVELREYEFDSDRLLCSNYPAARWGKFDGELLLVLAITPRKALVYSSSNRLIDSIPDDLKAVLFNLYTLGKAEEAYYIDGAMGDFVRAHLGWAVDQTLEESREYVVSILTSYLSPGI